MKSKPFQMNMKMQQTSVHTLIKKRAINQGGQCNVYNQESNSAAHVPPGRRRHAGSAVARGDGSGWQPLLAQTPAAAPKPRFVGVFFRTAWRRDTGCRRRKARFPTKLPYILESLEKVKDQTVGHQRPVVEVGGAAGGHDRLRSLGRGGVPDGHQAAQDRGFRRQRRQHHHRSDDRARRSARKTCCRRCSWRWKIRTRAPATAAKATAARTRTRSRGDRAADDHDSEVQGVQPASDGTRIRRSCSSGCSAAARRRKSAPQRMTQSRSILDSLLGGAARP